MSETINDMGSGSPRRPPRERFAGEEHLFDLAAESEALRAEADGERNGHRQITLFHDDTTTIVLFDFESGGYLLDHVVDGYVMIQVLSGEVRVAAAADDRSMSAGSLLVLTPGVHHDVRAVTASRMLLTVHL